MSDELTPALGVAGLAFAVVALAQIVTAVIARRVGRVSVVDVTWGLGFVAVALVGAVFGDGTAWRRTLVLVLVGAWGLRLAWHISRKHAGSSRPTAEDPRYAELLGGRGVNDGGFAVAVRKVFLIQGLAMLVVSLPVLAAMTLQVRWPWLVAAGVVVWVVGVFFEVVGDAQLAAYKKQSPRPPVLDTGLWAWTRHPNYFGDACGWWGLWLAGGVASGWEAALVTVIGPLAMTYFLAFATGARLLEQTMMRRPGYAEYAARTPMFVPRPPRRTV
jgi:steroid 5-alpha reductase family enzyme